MRASNVVAYVCLLAAGGVPALAADAAIPAYPQWDGQWARIGGPNFDPDKPIGRGQKAPLNEATQKFFDEIAENRDSGGLANSLSVTCIPNGMPRVMIDYETADIIITPKTTYMWFAFSNELRRIYTDDRKQPEKIAPSFEGYSIGQWKSSTGGAYDTLVVETRGFAGPRNYDGSGLPLDRDNQSVVRETITSDKSDPNVIHDEITVEDHALSQPWTVRRGYKRVKKIVWTENLCALDTSYAILGDENYFISADGYLMPARKGQKPPDLKNFSASGGDKK